MDITIRRGDTEVIDVAVTEPAADAADPPVPVPIGSATFAFTAKRTRRDPDEQAVLALTLGQGIVVTDGPGGLLTVTMTPAQTAALTPGRYDYDLQMTEGTTVTTIVDGTMLVEADVSRGT
jgi:hypothetical protein